MTEPITETKLTRKDFVSDQDVRWCPGCGDYAILAQMQKVLPELGIARENLVFVSGIGCASRFPYYMNAYGVHGIHGRAPTIATGLKLANPELSVWVITGDGDGLSIGGNHLVHCLRRNVDVKILLFNNRVYGLTKGQYSPTSLPGHRTKSSPVGSVDYALKPLSVALATEGTFVARTQDTNTKHLSEMLRRAASHKGTAFIEIFQNCVVYHPTAWEHTTNPDSREENTLFLEDGQPLIFGKNKDKGIRLNGMEPEVVSLGRGIDKSDLLVHHEGLESTNYAFMLSRMEHPSFPLPFGVLRAVDRPVYHELVLDQVGRAITESGNGDLEDLYRSSDTWEADESVLPLAS